MSEYHCPKCGCDKFLMHETTVNRVKIDKDEDGLIETEIVKSGLHNEVLAWCDECGVQIEL